jgi:hypothetical protein
MDPIPGWLGDLDRHRGTRNPCSLKIDVSVPSHLHHRRSARWSSNDSGWFSSAPRTYAPTSGGHGRDGRPARQLRRRRSPAPAAVLPSPHRARPLQSHPHRALVRRRCQTLHHPRLLSPSSSLSSLCEREYAAIHTVWGELNFVEADARVARGYIVPTRYVFSVCRGEASSAGDSLRAPPKHVIGASTGHETAFLVSVHSGVVS